MRNFFFIYKEEMIDIDVYICDLMFVASVI